MTPFSAARPFCAAAFFHPSTAIGMDPADGDSPSGAGRSRRP
jgi:hypothetical protein